MARRSTAGDEPRLPASQQSSRSRYETRSLHLGSALMPGTVIDQRRYARIPRCILRCNAVLHCRTLLLLIGAALLCQIYLQTEHALQPAWRPSTSNAQTDWRSASRAWLPPMPPWKRSWNRSVRRTQLKSRRCSRNCKTRCKKRFGARSWCVKTSASALQHAATAGGLEFRGSSSHGAKLTTTARHSLL